MQHHTSTMHHSLNQKIEYPLFSKKVFQLEYYAQIREQKSPSPPKICTPSQKAFMYLIKHNQQPKNLLSYSQSIRAIIYHLLS